jgi:hypothetical protein
MYRMMDTSATSGFCVVNVFSTNTVSKTQIQKLHVCISMLAQGWMEFFDEFHDTRQHYFFDSIREQGNLQLGGTPNR